MSVRNFLGYPACLLAGLILYRVLNSIIVRTYFTPDEFWQGPEVAHWIAFQQGHLTWEWLLGARIRGFLHAFLFAIIYKTLALLELDTRWAIAHSPKLFQGVAAGFGDYYTYGVALRWFGADIAAWALLLQVSNWFNFYCLVRPYSNSLEATLTVAAIYYWSPTLLQSQKKKGDKSRPREREHLALFLAALCVTVRPTSATIWALLGAKRLFQTPLSRWPAYVVKSVLPVGVLVVSGSTLLDRYMYGAWVFTPYEFLKFNLLDGKSAIFGVQPWHWLLSQGLPAILGASTPLFLRGCTVIPDSTFTLLIAWFTFAHSLSPHKEFRFLLPILPLANIISAAGLQNLVLQVHKRHPEQCKVTHRYIIVLIIVVLHLPFALYMSCIHQRGPLAVVDALGEELDFLRISQKREKIDFTIENTYSSLSAMFLMDCHSTPYTSHLHVQAPDVPYVLRFLDCSPTVPRQETESARFSSNPKGFVEQLFTVKGHMSNEYIEPLPDCVVTYPMYVGILHEWLHREGYGLSRCVFNTHVNGDMDSDVTHTHMVVLCRGASVRKGRSTGCLGVKGLSPFGEEHATEFVGKESEEL